MKLRYQIWKWLKRKRNVPETVCGVGAVHSHSGAWYVALKEFWVEVTLAPASVDARWPRRSTTNIGQSLANVRIRRNIIKLYTILIETWKNWPNFDHLQTPRIAPAPLGGFCSIYLHQNYFLQFNMLLKLILKSQHAIYVISTSELKSRVEGNKIVYNWPLMTWIRYLFISGYGSWRSRPCAPFEQRIESQPGDLASTKKKQSGD